MKRTKNTLIKALLSVFAVIAVMLTLSVSAFATDEGSEIADTITENIGSADKADEVEDTAEVSGEESLFTVMYQTVMKYTPEIFCALACGCYLILAFAYKKGLLPLIRNALSGIGSAVGHLKEQTETVISSSDGALAKVKESLDKAGETVRLLSERMMLIDSKLRALEKSGESVRVTEYLMNTQIDMLYELFMASGIPQFQKEAVAEKVKAMKEAINSENAGQEK